MNWFDESGFAYPVVEIIPSINRKITGFTLDVLIEMVQVVSWGFFCVDSLHCAMQIWYHPMIQGISLVCAVKSHVKL